MQEFGISHNFVVTKITMILDVGDLMMARPFAVVVWRHLVALRI